MTESLNAWTSLFRWISFSITTVAPYAAFGASYFLASAIALAVKTRRARR